MTYQPNIPNPNDLLSNSQADIKTNFQQLDTIFGIDHYKYSAGGGQAGKHDQVTLPLITGSAHPVVATGETKIYGMKEANFPTMDYSRYFDTTLVTSAVPTLLTNLQSPSAGFTIVKAGGTSAVFDFTGLSVVMCIFMAEGALTGGINLGSWMVGKRGGLYQVTNLAGNIGSGVAVAMVGNVLTITNANPANDLVDVYWSIDFLRAQV